MAKDPHWKYGWMPSDVVCIVILFLIIYTVAIWAGVKERKDQKGKTHKKSGVDYFLGGRHMGWVLIGVSIAASNIGTDLVLALTGANASAGIGSMSYEIGSGWSILCLGWLMGPMYLRSLLKTIPQYMEERYNPYCRVIFVLFSIAVFILSKFGVNVYAGSLVFQTMVGNVSLWAFIPVIVVITAIYTFMGGLTSVMWADLVQLGLFMITGYASCGYLLRLYDHKLGNLMKRMDQLGVNYVQHIIQPAHNPDYPWPATTIGMLVHEYYYWSTDQEMAQRVISSKGLGDARMGAALGAILKIACFYCTVIPGWTARTFYEECVQGISHFNWCGPNALAGNYNIRDGSDANRAYPLLVIREYPQGFKGIMIAGFLAANMSNLSGAVNSLSTILTYDLYARFFPPKKGQKSHSQRKLVFVGRTLVCICAGITLVWQIGITKIQINLFALTLAIQQHFGANIAATLLTGSVWRRSTQWGGLAGLSTGGIFAVVHVAMYLHNYNKCQTFVDKTTNLVYYPHRYYFWSCMHYTIVCCLIWGVTVFTNILVSVVTPKPDYAKIEKFTIQWEDLIPRYVTWFRPKLKKEALDYGYIDGIRREALEAQMAVDQELAEKKKQRQLGITNQSQSTNKKGPFAFLNRFQSSLPLMNKGGKKNAKENVAPNGNNGDGIDGQGQDPEDPVKEKQELVDPLLDDKYLEKARKDQYIKMQIADFMAIAAFFFAIFMFTYFR